MFVHAADIHLGITRYPKIDPLTGLNLRSQDFLGGFNELCDFVIDTRPDLFLLCGDLFDRVNPTNYMRRQVQQRFQELSQLAIDTIVISGNHETPRTKGVSNPLVLYKNMDHIHIILAPCQKDIGNYHIRAVPYTAHPQSYMDKPVSGKENILMMHTTIEGARVGSERFMCFDEEAVKRSEVPPYDYAALGHIHKSQMLSRNGTRIVYPGSIERYDFNEIDEKKGFYLVDGDPEFVGVNTRPMISREIMVDSLSGYDITAKSVEILKSEHIENKIVRLEFTGTMDDVERNSINFAEIKETALSAAYFALHDKTAASNYLNIKEEKVVFSPYAELERYLQMTGKYHNEVYELGNAIIHKRLEK
ncbi:MAG: metallophosphoesterase family protein [Candidatus Methanofastidiosia archaeon]